MVVPIRTQRAKKIEPCSHPGTREGTTKKVAEKSRRNSNKFLSFSHFRDREKALTVACRGLAAPAIGKAMCFKNCINCARKNNSIE